MSSPSHRPASRRLVITSLSALAAAAAAPALASSRRTVLPSMTDGPFYPPPAWRGRVGSDWDSDLTRVTLRGGQVAVARGEHMGLALQVGDLQGRLVDGAEVEIWQCDVQRTYRHPGVAAEPGSFDPGFQGFGAAKSDARGQLAFRTIRPVPYPGRTPHIHVKLRHPAFGEWTSQLFVAGDAGNARDFLWRQLDADGQQAAALQPQAVTGGDAGLRWSATHVLVVPTR